VALSLQLEAKVVKFWSRLKRS